MRGMPPRADAADAELHAPQAALLLLGRRGARLTVRRRSWRAARITRRLPVGRRLLHLRSAVATSRRRRLPVARSRRAIGSRRRRLAIARRRRLSVTSRWLPVPSNLRRRRPVGRRSARRTRRGLTVTRGRLLRGRRLLLRRCGCRLCTRLGLELRDVDRRVGHELRALERLLRRLRLALRSLPLLGEGSGLARVRRSTRRVAGRLVHSRVSSEVNVGYADVSPASPSRCRSGRPRPRTARRTRTR